MIRHVLLDTGPLVAFLNRRDRYHLWAVDQFARLRPPLGTCEAVLSEACFLLQRYPGGPESALELLRRQLVTVTFRLEEEVTAVTRLLSRYANVRMSLADACLVRMSEQRSESGVLTLDRHFRLYRRRGREVIHAIMPG